MDAELPAALKHAYILFQLPRLQSEGEAVSTSKTECTVKLTVEENTPIAEGGPNCDESKYGVVFCLTGRELVVAQNLEKTIPGVRAISPVKLRYRRMGGVVQEERITLFPGYVFIEARLDIEARTIYQDQNILKLLSTKGRDWHLTGSDKEIVKRFFRIGGVVGFSKAYFDESNRIHILSGFLKEYEGEIIRVNRRAKTAEIQVIIGEKKIDVWLGFEEIRE